MKLLFLSVPTGQGHNQVAIALENYYKETGLAECKTLDVFDNVNPFLGDSLQRSYLLYTKVAPKVYGTFYDMADKRDASKYSSVSKVLNTVLNKKLMIYIRNYKPDVIVATHTFAAIALSYIKRKYPIKAKTIAVITDFTVHPFWEDTDMDYYVTASELLDFQMQQKGFSKDRIKPFGIPIQPKFAQKLPKDEARRMMGLGDRFTILVMMGSMGYGSDTFKIIKELDHITENIQIIVVCGNNKRLKQRVDAYKSHKPIHCFGFTHEVDKLMDAADCIITKPGGLSTSEAIAKELPIIMLDPIPGQEDRNKEFMLNNGIALNISSTFTISEAIYVLLYHSYRLDVLKQNMKYIAKPNSTKDLADFIASISNQKEDNV